MEVASIIVIILVVIFVVSLLPIYHWLKSTYEVRKYLKIGEIQRKHRDVHVLKTKRGNIVYRYTKAYSVNESKADDNESESLLSFEENVGNGVIQQYPICLPGGLGSTLMNTSFIHARLVSAGFDVLSFDRIGVGLSSWTNDFRGKMEDAIKEMNEVMDDANPNAKGWIIIGGSYGSAVGQLYTARYPEKVVGFINWDGLPYYLSQIPRTRKSFEFVALIYMIDAIVSDLGLLRFPIWLATSLLKFSNSYKQSGFSWNEVYSEFQDSKLLRTVQKETPIMMECCDLLVEAWGDVNFDHLPSDLYEDLVHCPPECTIHSKDDGEDELHDKSSNDSHQQHELKEKLKDRPISSKLALRWRELPVVSLSCRNYDYDKREIFMTKQNKDLYAAEHTFLALFARDGRRIVFPDKTHGGSVTLGKYLVKYALHVAELATDFFEN